jgi:diguanylate cyclase (GGDEF)-like protein
MLWNQAAQSITGYATIEMLGRPVPEGLEPLLLGGGQEQSHSSDASPESHRSATNVVHKLGHFVPIIANILALNNGLGDHIGTAVLFHPAETLDALPQGERNDASWRAGARADLVERLQIEYDDLARNGTPFGILRISVDQVDQLRKTHGIAACSAMLEKVHHALAYGLRPGEEIGCWANDGFLVIAHERSAEMLAAHAKTLAGLARTADFQWWGDRISLTVSIGAAQVSNEAREGLSEVLRCAREAMETSAHEGGNRATLACNRVPIDAQETSPCLPS